MTGTCGGKHVARDKEEFDTVNVLAFTGVKYLVVIYPDIRSLTIPYIQTEKKINSNHVDSCVILEISVCYIRACLCMCKTECLSESVSHTLS